MDRFDSLSEPGKVYDDFQLAISGEVLNVGAPVLRWPSGLRRRSTKPLCPIKAPRVRIPASPPKGPHIVDSSEFAM